MDDLHKLDVTDIAARISARGLSPVEVMRATLARIDAVNADVNAIVALGDRERLMGAARVAEAMAPVGPLHGIPIAAKDLVAVRDIASTWGAPFLADHVPAADDGLARRLRAAGAILIGKTNVPQFGLGSHSVNPVYGATRNPHDPSRSAGGSSGGAAAALATGMLSVADGSDMMGSLRNPAAWNDVYGFRPTAGLVPGEMRDGWMGTRLATHGPMARSVAGLELLLGVMSDGVYAPVSHPGTAAAAAPRVGWLGDWGGAYPMEAGLIDLAEDGLRQMAALGWHVEPLAPPMQAAALWQSWTDLRSFTVAQEQSVNWRDPARRAVLNAQVTWEVTRGLALTGADVEAAAVLRRDWLDVLARLFAQVDMLVLPSTQVWPFPVGWDWPRAIAGQGMDTYHRWMEVVVPASLAGLPVVNLPAGFGADGVPGGVQVMAAPGRDAQLLAWARDYEAAIGPRAIVDPAPMP